MPIPKPLSLLPAALVAAAALLPAAAPTGLDDGVAKPGPVMQALMRDIEQAESKLVALAEAIPASSYDWRPAEGVRSVAEVFMHVAADNWFIPTAVGAAAPAATGITGDSYDSVLAYERRAATPAAALAEMRASFEHLERVMAGVDESKLHDPIDMFGHEATALDLWVLTATHLHEHLGQNIAYARSNGVVPPWSR